MLGKDRPSKNCSLLLSSCDVSTGCSAAELPASSPATTMLLSKNALLSQLSSSSGVPSASNYLSLSRHRAQTLQSIRGQAQRQRSKHKSSSRRTLMIEDATNVVLSNSSITDRQHASYIFSQRGTNVIQSASLKANSSSSSRKMLTRSSSLGVKKSKRPVNRQWATPIKSLHSDHFQGPSEHLKNSKLFEKNSLEARSRSFRQGSITGDDLRSVERIKTIYPSVEILLPGQTPIHRGRLLHQDLVPELKHLALGQLGVVRDPKSCSFCIFECSYGSSDEVILLSASESYPTCVDCLETHFFDEEYKNTELLPKSRPVPVLDNVSKLTDKYHILVKSKSGNEYNVEVESSDTVLDVKSKLSRQSKIDWNLHHLVSGRAILQNEHLVSTYRIGPESLTEIVELKRFSGIDITQFWKPTFCPKCPWTQVDVNLAKICILCAEQKHAIIGHSQHGDWSPFFNTSKKLASTHGPSYRQDNCMICTGLARMKCDGCPLLVCTNCSTYLDKICKGVLNLLIYHLSGQHIRNDAFLLRSDGGGF